MTTPTRVELPDHGAALLLLLVSSLISCGGNAVSDPAPDAPNPGEEPGPTVKTACECPTRRPLEAPECDCPGLECDWPRSFCWPGKAICSPEGEWDLLFPRLEACPEALPVSMAYCNGGGSCSYAVDVGCGLVELEALCTCLDASYLFQYPEAPPLCDCDAIGDKTLCQLYPRECAWSETLAACEAVQ